MRWHRCTSHILTLWAGVPATSVDYAEHCHIYVEDHPSGDPFYNFNMKVDRFVVSHVFGWFCMVRWCHSMCARTNIGSISVLNPNITKSVSQFKQHSLHSINLSFWTQSLKSIECKYVSHTRSCRAWRSAILLFATSAASSLSFWNTLWHSNCPTLTSAGGTMYVRGCGM